MRNLKYIGIVLMAGLLSLGLPSPTKVAAQPGVSVSFQVFFNSLSPFGNWSTHPQYGSVWIPSVHRDFHPYYTNGRWVMTEYGNTWVSDYEWGWAPFHYGRWFYDDYMGWAWVPDYTWGPGWVNWRTGGGYYGWAPLMPGANVRISINLPFNFWVFVPHRHFMHNNWHRYRVPHTRVTNVYHQTTVINNYYTYNNYEYAYGPRSSDIQQHTNKRVSVYNYSTRNTNGSFRESVARASNSSARRAIEVREQAFDNRPATATPGTGRSTTPTTNANTSGRTRTPATVTPRSADPIVKPDERRTAPERRSTSPSIRSTTPERSSSPATNRSRSREAVVPSAPAEGGSRRIETSTPANRSEPSLPSRGSESRTRVRNVPTDRTTTPSTRTAPERTAPVNNRSGARTNVSSGERAPSTSPARSASPVRSTPSTPSGRSSTSERGGR